MKSMMVPLLLLGGLTLGTAALAAEPAATDAAVQGDAMKVAIDPVTGKRRPITAAESRALDLQTRSKSSKGLRSTTANTALTMEQAIANGRTINGITSIRVPMSEMSAMTATIDANGNVLLSHDGVASSNSQELPSE